MTSKIFSGDRCSGDGKPVRRVERGQQHGTGKLCRRALWLHHEKATARQGAGKVSNMELTIITAVAVILFLLERVYARKEMIRCSERIEGMLDKLLTEIKHQGYSREVHHPFKKDLTDIGNSLSSAESSLDFISGTLNDIDMALHGDYANPIQEKLNCPNKIENCLSNIEDYLRSTECSTLRGQ